MVQRGAVENSQDKERQSGYPLHGEEEEGLHVEVLTDLV